MFSYGALGLFAKDCLAFGRYPLSMGKTQQVSLFERLTVENYVIWLDSEKAQIFALETSGIKKSHLERGGVDHHSRNPKDNPGDSQTEHFFRDLAAKLANADQLLILGPGLAKAHFKTHLETHHVNGLAKKIIGVENSDHPTDKQILAVAREFYKTYDLFNNPIIQ